MRRSFTVPAMALALGLAACGDAPMLPEPAAPAAARVPKASPGEATASSALTVTYLNCYDAGGGGYAYTTTACTGLVGGGTGGNTYTWDVIQTWREDSEAGSQIYGVCNRGTYLTVTFTVTDSSGATASASTTFYCHWIVP